MACFPMMTRPGFSCSTMALRILATASGSSVLSVFTRMPRSAPMARPVRMVSAACGGPLDTQTNSVALPLSFCPSAPPTPISSHGFLDGDLVEGIHRHLDVRQLDAAAVALDANFDVVVDDPLHGHQNFHGVSLSRRQPRRPRAPGKDGGNLMAAALQCQRRSVSLAAR